MKLLNFDPQQFSKVSYNIGGIPTHVYNSDTLKSYVESFTHQHQEDIPINVLYLIHQRGGHYKYTEAIAYNILERYSCQTPLICITFDLRNHGSRVVDEQSNLDWNKGNKTHASDMWSIINGSIDDIKSIMDHLPTYLNLEYYLHETCKKEHNVKFKYNNILSGVSLGGHIVYRFGLKYPDLTYMINPIVGSTDLTSLLYTRLKKSTNYSKKYFYFNYDELELTDDEKLNYYPESLHNQLSSIDTEIFENYPNSIKIFACFGGKDTLVPYQLSKTWCDLYSNTTSSCNVYLEEELGHDISEKMIYTFSQWLNENI